MKYKKNIPVIILVLVLAGSLVAGGLVYIKYKDVNKKYTELLKNSPAEVTKSLVDKIGKVMILPKDETPSVATVEDKDKLKDQPFFADSEKGDKLLIYQGAKKAIIYRESSGKIINQGPIAIQQNAKVAVKILGKVADRDAVEKILNEKFPNTLTITKGDAKNTYSSTLVVDINNNQKTAQDQIVSAIKGAKVGELPAGEDKPGDSVFVILAGP